MKLIKHAHLGIDTIEVMLPVTPGLVRSRNTLAIRRGTSFVKERLLFTDSEGHEQMGVRARTRVDGVDVRIKPVSKNKGVYAMGLMGCFVQFSVSRLVGAADNTRPGTAREMRLAFDRVQHILDEVGINANFLEGKVCRIDIFTNFILQEPVPKYIRVLQSTEPPRYKQLLYPNGIVYYCREQSLSFYGKGAERRFRGFESTDVGDHAMRAEWQIKRARAVFKKLGVQSVADVLTNFEAFPAAYIHRMNSLLFIREFDESILRSGPMRDRTKAQVKTFLRWLRKRGINMPMPQSTLVSVAKMQGIERFARIVRESSPLKANAYVSIRLRRLRIAAFNDACGSTDAFAARYVELRDTIRMVAPESC
jgi:hypothetical protein